MVTRNVANPSRNVAGESIPETGIFELSPEQLLMIIKGYAFQGASDDYLVSLLEHLSPHTPLINTKEYKDINTHILKILAGERDRSRGISGELKTYIESMHGTFTLSDCYIALEVKDAKSKSTLRRAVERLCESKQLERIGTKGGTYRKPDTSYDVIDLDGTVPDPLPVELPLRVDQFCNVYNGMTILYEGEKSTGKSACAIEVAWLNRNLFPDKVRYMQNGELNKQMTEGLLRISAPPVP